MHALKDDGMRCVRGRRTIITEEERAECIFLSPSYVRPLQSAFEIETATPRHLIGMQRFSGVVAR